MTTSPREHKPFPFSTPALLLAGTLLLSLLGYVVAYATPVQRWLYLRRWTKSGSRPRRPALYSGRWRDWNREGSLERDVIYRDGNLVSGREYARVSGQCFVGTYVDGERWQGRFVWPQRSGRVFIEEYAEGRRLAGRTEVLWLGEPNQYKMTVTYYGNGGVPRGEYRFLHGKRHGRCADFEAGSVTWEQYYYLGEEVSKQEFEQRTSAGGP